MNSYYLTELGPVLRPTATAAIGWLSSKSALYRRPLHLAAEALGLGAVGSTSFDDEVIDSFRPAPRTQASCS